MMDCAPVITISDRLNSVIGSTPLDFDFDFPMVFAKMERELLGQRDDGLCTGDNDFLLLSLEEEGSR